MAVFLTPVITEHEGELFFANLLKNALNDEYYCWHEVSIKAHSKKTARCPDFIIFNPRYGFWVLEVKDWSLSYIKRHNQKQFFLANGETSDNPHEQATKQMWALRDLLKLEREFLRDGKLIIPLESGAVFSNITRREFEFPSRLGNIPSQSALCADEIKGKQSSEKLEQRLLAMLTSRALKHVPFSEKQVNTIRNLIFPDIQIITETTVQSEIKKTRLIDYDQEKVFRQLNLGTGAHILFGVAGSGKTIILLNKASELLKQEKDRLAVLYLCRGTCVAKQIQAQAANIGLPKNAIASFHKWCSTILRENNIPVPRSYNHYSRALSEAIKQGKIKPNKYDAILLDEGHDFKDKPDWLELISSMLRSEKSLFVMAYDEAQAIYGGENVTAFDLSFLKGAPDIKKHILRKNYRNTEQIFLFAKVLADSYLIEAEDESIPRVRPIGHGEKGKLPLLLECTSFEDELNKVAFEIKRSLAAGRKLSEIAILSHQKDLDRQKQLNLKIEQALIRLDIPCTNDEGDFTRNLVKVMSVTKAKGLGFGMVCLVGIASPEFGDPTREGSKKPSEMRKHLEDDIRYLYNATTRALEELVITYTRPDERTLASKRILKLAASLDRVKSSEPTVPKTIS